MELTLREWDIESMIHLFSSTEEFLSSSIRDLSDEDNNNPMIPDYTAELQQIRRVISFLNHAHESGKKVNLLMSEI